MTRRPLRLLAMSVIVFTTLPIACRKTGGGGCPDAHEKTDQTRSDDVLDPETRDALTKAVSNNPKLCQELTQPRISLTADDLVVDAIKERKLARRSDLPASEIHRIDRLFYSLIAFRHEWKEIHPGMDFRSNAELRVDPMLETPRAASIILSAAHGGYPHLRVTSAASTFDVEFYVRGPPDGRYIDRVLHIEASDETSSIVRLFGPVCAKSPGLTVNNSDLGPTVARLCKDNPKIANPSDPSERIVMRCVDSVELRVLPTARFGDTAKILRSIIVALADQKPTVDIALLLLGSEPKMKQPKSPWRGLSFYAPNVDGSAHCTLPDGGYADALPESQLLPDGGLIWE